MKCKNCGHGMYSSDRGYIHSTRRTLERSSPCNVGAYLGNICSCTNPEPKEAKK